jgi:hypothetical protein
MVRPAFLVIGAGIAYSQIFYPQVRTEFVRPAVVKEQAPIRRVPNPAPRITVTVTHIPDFQPGDASVPQGLRLLYEMGQDVLREEAERNV